MQKRSSHRKPSACVHCEILTSVASDVIVGYKFDFDVILPKTYYKIDDDRFTTDTYGRERSATFIASYPDKLEEIDKEVFVSFDTNGIIEKDHVKISNHFSEGLAFEATCISIDGAKLGATTS